MENSQWFARFIKEIKIGEKGVFFAKDNDTVNTRYFIVKEDIENYYIVKYANYIGQQDTFRINKKYENKLFDVYIEAI